MRWSPVDGSRITIRRQTLASAAVAASVIAIASTAMIGHPVRSH
jgi:hypothetical protein